MPIMLDDALLTDAEAADLTRLTKDQLAKLRRTRDGARYIKVGRKVFYRRSAITAWLNSLERDCTTAVGSSADRAA
jgi:hypothetical protein